MKDSLCRHNAGMRKLLEAINAAPAGIAFIVDEEDKLCGVITDGDFRRLLISGRSLDESLSKSDLKPFVSAAYGTDVNELIHLTNNKVRIIPLVDDQGKLVDYFRYEHRINLTPVAEPSLSGNEFNYLNDAFLSTWISSLGEYITRFENDFSKFCDTKYGVAVSNGTVAIHLALRALNIGPGDEVIIPDLTFAATGNAVLHANAIPVIVDVDSETWCISIDAIKKAITPRTKAIMPVHVYGQPCDMDAIMQIAREHNLFVIEDAAEAHGATYKGKPVGSFGDIACFSFFANKIITTGEGGMCMTNSEELNHRMRTLRDHGMNKQKKYWHDEVGYNYRMTNLQAAIGCAQLERADKLIAERIRIEKEYIKRLEPTGLIKFQTNVPNQQKVTWLVSALTHSVEHRNKIFSALKQNMIDARPFFYPMSIMPPFIKYAKTCIHSHQLSEIGFNLPTVSNVDFNRVEEVFHSIK